MIQRDARHCACQRESTACCNDPFQLPAADSGGPAPTALARCCTLLPLGKLFSIKCSLAGGRWHVKVEMTILRRSPILLPRNSSPASVGKVGCYGSTIDRSGSRGAECCSRQRYPLPWLRRPWTQSMMLCTCAAAG